MIFRYTGGTEDAIKDVTLQVEARETAALVGPSGGGKTTVAGLISRFWDVADGVQECLEAIRDLKSNKAEQAYLDGLDKKIDVLEGRAIKSELGAAMFVVPAQMVLKLGMASVALVGSMRLISGELAVPSHILPVPAGGLPDIRTNVVLPAEPGGDELPASKHRPYE